MSERATLRDYVRHREGCPVLDLAEVVKVGGAKCTCGLRELLYPDSPIPARGDVEALIDAFAQAVRTVTMSSKVRSVIDPQLVSERQAEAEARAALLAALAPEREPAGFAPEFSVKILRELPEYGSTSMHVGKSRDTTYCYPVYIGTPLTPESDDGE